MEGGHVSSGYRGSPSERWPGDSLLSPLNQNRQDTAWPPSSSAHPSSHTMTRRREGNSLQSDTWSSIQSQSNGRWQNQSQEPPSSTATSSSLYERSRIRSSHPYDDGQMIHRRDTDGIQANFPLRYMSHPAGTREGALQRLHWQSRDTTDTREGRRGSQQATSSFSPSPTLPFTPQGYHSSTPTYTSSWTPSDTNLLTTPTLHSVPSQASVLSFDGSYSSNSTTLTTPDEFEEYRES